MYASPLKDGGYDISDYYVMLPEYGTLSVEVKLVWANKGEVLARIAAGSTEEPAFCLASGDDRTDEDLFARLPAEAWTVHIGDRRSRAQFCLSSPAEMRQLLGSFAEADETKAAATFT